VIHGVLGLAAYIQFLITGNYDLISWYFSQLGLFFLVGMAAAEMYFAWLSRAQFDRDEPLHRTWTLIFLAATARLVGNLIGYSVVTNGLWLFSRWPGVSLQEGQASWHQFGLAVAGPVAMAFYAAGLWRALSLKRKFRFLGPLALSDKLLIAVVCIFTARELFEIATLLIRHFHPSVGLMVLWFSDPLLAVLLIQAVMIRRSVLSMGGGLVAQCWGAIVVATVTVSIGDVALWADGKGLLPRWLAPWGWYVWFFAAAAYATAPVYQVYAVWHAQGRTALTKQISR